MFRNRGRRNPPTNTQPQSAAPETDIPEDMAEWEEVEQQPTATGSENRSTSGTFGGRIAVSGEDAPMDISDFPAMRMAGSFGTAAARADAEEYSQPTQEDAPAYYSSDGDDLSPLIRRYAALEDEEIQGDKQPDGEEQLPLLFRQAEPRITTSEEADESAATTESEPDGQQPQPEEQDEEFTMESELEKQQLISAELFGFIDTITSETEQESLRRSQAAREQAKPVARDPYNTAFNSRYLAANTEPDEVSEIDLAPKYRLENGQNPAQDSD